MTIGLMVFIILIVAMEPSIPFIFCVIGFTVIMFILALVESNNNYKRNHKKKGDDE